MIQHLPPPPFKELSQKFHSVARNLHLIAQLMVTCSSLSAGSLGNIEF